MARYIGPVCRLCRREGEKLFLKGERCFSDKCAIERRNYVPGQHGQRRRQKITPYGIQLRAKQKAKRMYGLLEKQFRLTFQRAERKRGVTGEVFLTMLERRLDSVVHRSGFATSLQQARQLVRHRHIQVGGKAVDIPSYQVKQGEVVAVRQQSRGLDIIRLALERAERRGVPQWLELDRGAVQSRIVQLPTRQECSDLIDEQLIVELYSK
ncbi:MAG: 30S ribosomal protein S4 [Candidatus Tectomicrobia bacterium]|nr:30S ribosomal protein S4 [Candidatus Tectomicrobia bacterium]